MPYERFISTPMIFGKMKQGSMGEDDMQISVI